MPGILTAAAAISRQICGRACVRTEACAEHLLTFLWPHMKALQACAEALAT
jgi:hypothetical protein